MNLYILLLPFIFSFINRLRGSGYIPGGKYITAVLAAITIYFYQIHLQYFYPDNFILSGVLFGLCWIVWEFPPWSEWMHLGVTSPVRTPTAFEAFINKITGNNATLALLIRETVFLIPVAILFNWTFLLLGPAIVLAYAIGKGFGLIWKTIDTIMVSEFFAGFFWGIAVLYCLV